MANTGTCVCGYHFDRVLEKAGITNLDKRDLVPYSFRHYFITQRVNSHLTPAIVAEMCGTSITQIEKTYYHTTEAKMVAYDNGEGGVEYDVAMSFKALSPDRQRMVFDKDAKGYWVNNLISSFENTKKPFAIVYPIPEVGWNVPNYNFKYFLEYGSPPQSISTSYEKFKERNAFINQLMDGYQGGVHLIRFKPETVLCNTYVLKRCVAQFNQQPLYHDDDHLSNLGASLLIQPLLREMKIY